jgi:primary-amine oxidase
MTSVRIPPTPVALAQHPLDPLTAEEVSRAVKILRTEYPLSGRTRFATVVLQEPPKSVVLDFEKGDAIQREAFAILLDNATATTIQYEVKLTAWSTPEQ